jgi:hypothetical protein
MTATFLNHCHPERSAKDHSHEVRGARAPGRSVTQANAVLNHCHPERSAKERSDKARVEGPASLSIITTMSGNSNHTS